MVSTRGPKIRYFENGEKVLCYEPDPSKAKVLYDSKILGTCEAKDKRGRKVIQYKVHFQGWSSSWDRKVSADFVLKDTEENRQLQRDLAVKAQLQLGAYLYRKERGGGGSSNKKRFRKWIASTEESCDINALASNKLRSRGCSEDNFSSSSTLEKHDDFPIKDYCETDSCDSSVESTMPDEKRITLRVSKRLRYYLEYDYEKVVRLGHQHRIPADISAITILENFVKQTALKMFFAAIQSDAPRKRNFLQRIDRKEKDYDKIINTTNLLKEVADGLRIYLDFITVDYLLYNVEKKYVRQELQNRKQRDFKYIEPETWPLDLSNVIKVDQNSTTSNSTLTKTELLNATLSTSPSLSTLSSHTTRIDEQMCSLEVDEQPLRRKLRSHRHDECNTKLQNCLTSIINSSPTVKAYLENSLLQSHLSYLRSLPPVPPHVTNFVQYILTWHLLPISTISNPQLLSSAPAMLFGATHLARLIVKLPDFLNASLINDDKLKILIHHLDMFVNFLENHQGWFNDGNYIEVPSCERKVPLLHIRATDRQVEKAAMLNQIKITRQRNHLSSLSIRNLHSNRKLCGRNVRITPATTAL